MNPQPYSLTPYADKAYRDCPPFRKVVDTLILFLRESTLTPSELRQAVILAATMHEATVIRPLLLPLDYNGLTANFPYGYASVIPEGTKFNVYGATSGRFDASKPNVSNDGKPAYIQRSLRGDRRTFPSVGGGFNREQSRYESRGYDKATGDRRKKVEKNEVGHVHFFNINRGSFMQCSCGLSNVYFFDTATPKQN